jgi:hypothetical protein
VSDENNKTSDVKARFDLVVVDLDKTLLNSKHELSERNEKALKAAMEQGVKVVLATGKTRTSAQTVIDRLDLTTPGIYLQGLTIHNHDGTISYQKTLDPTLARRIITFAEDRGFTVIAYSGEKLLSRAVDEPSFKFLTDHHEPRPEAIGPLQNILDEMTINKLFIIKTGDGRRIRGLRWQLEMQIDGKAKLMQAIDDTVEVLPPNTSKGVALKTLTKELNIPTERVLAIGDGENDLEMLQYAGMGVAIGNAIELLKDTADEVVGTNDEDGVAEAIERFVLHQPAETVGNTETADDKKSAEPSTESEEQTEA